MELQPINHQFPAARSQRGAVEFPTEVIAPLERWGVVAKYVKEMKFVDPRKPRCLMRPHRFSPEGETLAAALEIIDTAN